VSNPVGPSIGYGRVLRGGSWQVVAKNRLRAAARHSMFASAKSADVGFRCVRGWMQAHSTKPPAGQPAR
jgi:formylglycine-generating enzyme required for sulfatase activity